MQFCTCTVRHAGDMTMEVPNKVVSVPEIDILRFLHGKDAVLNIVAVQTPQRKDIDDPDGPPILGYGDDTEHEAYLRSTYGNKAVDEVYGKVIRKLPTTLQEIGINPQLEAENKREAALKLLREADALDGGHSADTPQPGAPPVPPPVPPVPVAATPAPVPPPVPPVPVNPAASGVAPTA